MKQSYQQTLAAVKSDEQLEVVLSVMDDPVAAKVLVAWTNARTRPRRQQTRLLAGDASAKWDWLWRNTRYSLTQLACQSDLPVSEVRRKMQKLVGIRAVYPDGTLNQYVRRFLRKTVVDIFETSTASS